MTKSAIEMLKADHVVLRSLLEKLTETTERAQKTRTELLARIASELSVHTTLEEEIFYPALRESGDDEAARMYFEALEEHRAVEELVLPDLEKTKPASEQFSGRAKVLKELIEHHADEEEDEMFPLAKKLLGAQALRELGERMAERRKAMERVGASVS